MIRAHIAAPQQGVLRSELQREDTPGTPALPAKPITATEEAPTPAATPAAAHDSPVAASAAPLSGELRGAGGSDGGSDSGSSAAAAGSKRSRDDDWSDDDGACKRPATSEPSEPSVAELLALASSSGDANPLAAHRLLEAVQGGALRQAPGNAAAAPSDASCASVDALDPMCCVGCGALLQDLTALGLRSPPTQWEWTCQSCLPAARSNEHPPPHAIGTPEQ